MRTEAGICFEIAAIATQAWNWNITKHKEGGHGDTKEYEQQIDEKGKK